MSTTKILGSEITASRAISASYASTAQTLLGSVTSASFASTASYVNTLRQSVTVSGSLGVTGSLNTQINDNAFGVNATLSNINAGSSSLSGISFKNASQNAFSIFQVNSSGDASLYNTATGGKLNFWTNTTQRMTIDASGNVGIGTTTPTYPLDIYNTSMGLGNGSGMPTTINFDNGQYIVAYGSAGWFKSGNVITLDSNSFVGINTFSPEYQLDVAGAGKFLSGLLVTGSLNITGSQVITGSLRGNVSSLSISSNTASVNMSSGNFFTLTLANGANTHIRPTNMQPGQTVNIRVNQGSDGTGTVSFPSFVDQASGSLYTGSMSANAIDIVTMITFDSSIVFVSSIRNMI
jgi:hypothetical protein